MTKKEKAKVAFEERTFTFSSSISNADEVPNKSDFSCETVEKKTAFSFPGKNASSSKSSSRPSAFASTDQKVV